MGLQHNEARHYSGHIFHDALYSYQKMRTRLHTAGCVSVHTVWENVRQEAKARAFGYVCGGAHTPTHLQV